MMLRTRVRSATWRRSGEKVDRDAEDQAMKMRSNLFVLGIILIAFPMACLVTFVLALSNVLLDLEHKLSIEEKSADLIHSTQSLLSDTTDEFLELGVGFGVVKGSVKTFQTKMHNLEPRYESLVEKLSQEPHQRKRALEIERLWNSLYTELHPPGRPLHYEYIVGSEMSRLGINLINKLFETALSEETSNRKQASATAKVLEDLLKVLVIGLFLSIAGALVLWSFYFATVGRPLQHLIYNGQALGAGLKLQPQLNPFIEITELTRLDRLIREVADAVDESLGKERDTITYAQDLICSTDEGGHFQSVNPYVKTLLGFDGSEVIGNSLYTYVYESDRQSVREKIGEAIKSGVIQVFEATMRTKPGSFVQTRWSCLHSAEHHSLFLTIHDINEEKRIERLKADFSETVSEELKTPLVALNSSLDGMLAGERGVVPERLKDILSRTKTNIESLILLANDLLDFQKLRGTSLELEKRPEDLIRVVEDACEYVSANASLKEIHLSVNAPARLWMNCDRMRILQTIVNLVSNAIKFTPEGGSVEVRISQDGNDGINLLVLDSGAGVPVEHHERVFQAFEQVESKHSKFGTGLGLAICKMFVEAHGGTIKVMPPDEIEERAITFSNGQKCRSIFSIMFRQNEEVSGVYPDTSHPGGEPAQ